LNGIKHRLFLKIFLYFIYHWIKKKSSQTPVAHAYNPSSLGGWEQEDSTSRPAWAKKNYWLRLELNQ
jgi:hypothetical protein